jgi:hypothetical protein
MIEIAQRRNSESPVFMDGRSSGFSVYVLDLINYLIIVSAEVTSDVI